MFTDISPHLDTIWERNYKISFNVMIRFESILTRFLFRHGIYPRWWEKRAFVFWHRGHLFLTETKALANIYAPWTELWFLTREKTAVPEGIQPSLLAFCCDLKNNVVVSVVREGQGHQSLGFIQKAFYRSWCNVCCMLEQNRFWTWIKRTQSVIDSNIYHLYTLCVSVVVNANLSK